MGWALQEVIAQAEGMAASVPGTYRLTSAVTQAAAHAAVHAVLIEQVPGQIVASNIAEAAALLDFAQAILEDAAALRVEDGQRFAFGIQGCAAGIALPTAVISNRQTGAAQRVEVGDSW